MIGVHATWYMANGGHWVSSGAILALLHYTRESFMALTGFVLTYSMSGRRIQWLPVLAKRYRLVAIPYVFWSVAYLLAFRHDISLKMFLVRLGRYLLDGQAWYHLYYLLVTMQFYALLPLFLLLMKLARRAPVAVLGLAIVAQLALMSYDQYGLGPHPQGINAHVGTEVWTYSAYFVLGGVGALFWPAVRQWLLDHLLPLTTLAVGSAALMMLQFALQMHSGPSLSAADSVVQPAMVPWAITAIVFLAAIGVRYEKSLLSNPHAWPFIKWAADLSFGLYLIHPMILQYWTNILAYFHRYRPSFWLDGVTWALLVTTSGLASAAIARTPLSQFIIGRSALPAGIGRAAPSRRRAVQLWRWVKRRSVKRI